MTRGPSETFSPDGAFGDEEPTLTGRVHVQSGWCLDLTGGYGMFNDDIGAPGFSTNYVTLCHDCCLKVARALPGIFTTRRGMHSMTDDEKEKTGGKSCCEFAWSTDEHGCSVIGDGHGGWVEVVGPDGTIIK